MPRRLPYELLILGALLLGSCDARPVFTDAQRDAIGDIAGDAVGDAVADSDEISDLKSRVDAIEARLNM